MFCSSCGTRNEEGTAYRVSCGAELRKIQTPGVEVPRAAFLLIFILALVAGSGSA